MAWNFWKPVKVIIRTVHLFTRASSSNTCTYHSSPGGLVLGHSFFGGPSPSQPNAFCYISLPTFPCHHKYKLKHWKTFLADSQIKAINIKHDERQNGQCRPPMCFFSDVTLQTGNPFLPPTCERVEPPLRFQERCVWVILSIGAVLTPEIRTCWRRQGRNTSFSSMHIKRGDTVHSWSLSFRSRAVGIRGNHMLPFVWFRSY